jgi:apolipoprotein N-acyltransferase
MNYAKLIFLSVLSGLLLSLAWFNWSSGLYLFIAFLPLLYLENEISKPKIKNKGSLVFLLASLTFLIWNIDDTWWISYVTIIGALAVILANTFLMASVFWLFHITKRKLGNFPGYVSLIIYWTAFEYLFLNGELYWPWLDLGNGFAKDIKLIQWYEYTGVLGGTVWCLTVNVILFYLMVSIQTPKKNLMSIYSIALLLLISVPVIFSLSLYNSDAGKGKSYNIVIVQPNINPYTEKFGGLSCKQQLDKILNLANQKAGKKVDYFVCPETAIVDSVWEDSINTNQNIKEIKKFLKPYPKAKFIIGLTLYKEYNYRDKTNYTARKLGKTNLFYDSFNAAIQIDSSNFIPIYRKSKMVIGLEKIPYQRQFSFLTNSTIDLGGPSGSLGFQEKRDVFINLEDRIKIAPIICYESDFGEYVTDYVKKGAGLFFILTNDGWWKNSQGIKQHLSFARLRAIENRRGVARSANTGISAFIDQCGKIIQATRIGEATTIEGRIKPDNSLTFYSVHGDYIGRIALFFSIILLVLVFVIHLSKKVWIILEKF